MNSFLCIDVGGSEIKALIFNEKGDSLTGEIKHFPANSDLSKEEIFLNFSQIINHFTSENYNITGIGMAFPGPFDYKNGISLMKKISKYDSIYRCNIEEEIKRLNNNWINNCKFVFIHDIAAFALGCCENRPNLKQKRVMYLCIGTGAGTAFTNNGKIVDNSSFLPKNGWVYDTKFKKSTIDDYISIRGLKHLSEKYFNKNIDGYNLQKLAESGNKLAVELFNEFGDEVKEAISPFLKKYRVQNLILGGQISKGFLFFSKTLESYCSKKGINIECVYDTSTNICLGVFKLFSKKEETMELHKEKGAQPLYFQLYELIKSKIESEIYNYGDIVQSEKELMDQFGISRITVRQAISNLTHDGYLEGKRGIGTIVKYIKIDENIDSVISFSDEMKHHGIIMKTSYCKVKKIKANNSISTYLGCKLNETCIKIERVRCANNDPIVYSVTYVNKDWDLDLNEKYYTDSFYKYLSDEKGITVVKARDTLEAGLANEEIADFLNIEKDRPVFIRTRKSYTKDNKLIEYTKSHYPGDKYKYSMDL